MVRAARRRAGKGLAGGQGLPPCELELLGLGLVGLPELLGLEAIDIKLATERLEVGKPEAPWGAGVVLGCSLKAPPARVRQRSLPVAPDRAFAKPIAAVDHSPKAQPEGTAVDQPNRAPTTPTQAPRAATKDLPA